jgi:hypothetical protein
VELNKIQIVRIMPKRMINFQLPPKLATLSESVCPLVITSLGG